MSLEKNLHHAYLCIGQKNFVISSLEKEFEKLDIKIKGNPDYFKKEYNLFGIDDAREIKDFQSKKSANSKKKIFVIAFNSITKEAQNSFLKVFEEPTEDTHFFVVVSSQAGFLKTLISRTFVCEFKDEKYKTEHKEKLIKFIKSSPAQRIVMLEDLMEKKDKKELGEILDFLIEYFSKTENIKYTEELLKLKKYLEFKSSSVKIITEHLCLSVPNISVNI